MADTSETNGAHSGIHSDTVAKYLDALLGGDEVDAHLANARVHAWVRIQGLELWV